MEEQSVTFDSQALERTSQLFAAKRRLLPPDTIARLAKTIVSQLAGATQNAFRSSQSAISAESLEAFCDTLLYPEPDAAWAFIQARLDEGITRQSVYLGYIGAAARRLGEGWDEDRLSFVDVTIGTGHLYAIMRAMRVEGPASRPAFDGRRCAMFATVPDENHSVGITLAANFFRDAGWEIDLQIGRDHDGLIAHVEQTEPRIIGLSLSTERRFEALTRLVVALRIVVPESTIGVAAGEALTAHKIRDLVDIDLLFGDAHSALAELEEVAERRV